MLEALRSSVDGLTWPAVPDQAGGAMLSVLFQLERSQWLSPAELWTLQRRQLAGLLRHAAAHVPFYRGRFPRKFTDDDASFSLSDFAELPTLSRAQLQDHFSTLTTTRLPEGHGSPSENATSGSTGEPVRFLATPVSQFYWHAFMLREHLWHRREFSEKMVAMRVGGDSRAVQEHWLGDAGKGLLRTGPCVVLPVKWTFDRQLDCILEERPAYLLGYATNLLGVLQAAQRRGVTMPWLREARSFGEAVPAHMRDYIRTQWQIPLSDVYTARETGYVALQCPESGEYHVQSESVLLEVVGEDGAPCGAGEIGRVLVTPLHNFAMPLIRYDIGDYAEVGPACRCGRGLPVLRRILGRRRNMLRLPDGSMRWPTLGTEVMMNAAPVRRFKVIQKSLREIEVRMVAARAFSDGETSALRRHFGRHFGPGFEIRFVFLDEFPAEPGDKFEDFVSEVA
ncbi:MAG TPA: hypothetical protein VHB46_03630 [Burkholderiales bacterium]|nr:hypothetical protein [Burkholderiales bacterium]